MSLRDAIDQDKFIIDEHKLSDSDIQAMSIDELETLKLRINKRISGIESSIKEKQNEYASGGQRASREWYKNKRNALSINKRVLSYVNSVVKQRIRTSRSISDYFMDQARAILSKKDFELILGNAHREKELDDGRAPKCV